MLYVFHGSIDLIVSTSHSVVAANCCADGCSRRLDSFRKLIGRVFRVGHCTVAAIADGSNFAGDYFIIEFG
jgi:hypothetical protein